MTVPPDIHIAVIKPDDRGRFLLGRWASRNQEIVGWKVFVGDDGETLRLEAIT